MGDALRYSFDEDLREVFAEGASERVPGLLASAQKLEDPVERARALGEVGVYLRISRQLEESQRCLEESLRLLRLYAPNPAALAMAELRLAHLHQWKGAFERSDQLFGDLLARCADNEALRPIADFVWQHAGKNHFDQRRFVPALLAFETALKLRRERQAPADQIESTELALRAVKRKMGF
jgi:tetratricopeptide (TPR) repeat protein